VSAAPSATTRSPADIGYLPWLLHRSSALVLVGLVSIHVAVQAYGYTAPYRWGIYGALLDLTLGLVLLHGFLGVRATILETSLPSSARAVLVWLRGILSFGLFFVRLLVL